MVICIGLRIPRFIEAAHRYAGPGVIHALQFSELKLNTLAKDIGHHHVIVQTNDPMYAIPILVEFGRGKMNLEWAPETWNVIVAYRHWSAPTIIKSHYYLTLLASPVPPTCKVIDRTNQYQLLFCENRRAQ